MENTIAFINFTYCIWDHLHMRGEYNFNELVGKVFLGSPPHAWRILQVFYLSFSADEDHLHMRGEYFAVSFSNFLPSGSPPHAWRIL